MIRCIACYTKITKSLPCKENSFSFQHCPFYADHTKYFDANLVIHRSTRHTRLFQNFYRDLKGTSQFSLEKQDYWSSGAASDFRIFGRYNFSGLVEIDITSGLSIFRVVSTSTSTMFGNVALHFHGGLLYMYVTD
jgi:hypothetical protein